MYNPEDWLTAPECAVIARKHRRTIVNWIREGHLSASRMPGKRGEYRVHRDDLEKILSRPVMNG